MRLWWPTQDHELTSPERQKNGWLLKTAMLSFMVEVELNHHILEIPVLKQRGRRFSCFFLVACWNLIKLKVTGVLDLPS